MHNRRVNDIGSCFLTYEKFLDGVLLNYVNVCSVCACTKYVEAYMYVVYLKFKFSSTTKFRSYQYQYQTRIHDYKKQAKAKHKAQTVMLTSKKPLIDNDANFKNTNTL